MSEERVEMVETIAKRATVLVRSKSQKLMKSQHLTLMADFSNRFWPKLPQVVDVIELEPTLAQLALEFEPRTVERNPLFAQLE